MKKLQILFVISILLQVACVTSRTPWRCERKLNDRCWCAAKIGYAVVAVADDCKNVPAGDMAE